MRMGYYKDPKHPVKKRAKIVCVICTYVPEGQIENCPCYSSHTREACYHEENKLETIKFNLACHEHFRPGLDYDIIIVDNESPDQETLKYLKTLKKYQVFSRPNVGFSFGAFKYIWEKFGDFYDYYLFCEQDGVPAKNNWLKEVLLTFLKEPNVGAVGNFVESRHIKESSDFFKDMAKKCPSLRDRDYMCNLDGFMSFTSSKILKECGGPFVFEVKGKTDIEARANWCELCFHQPILECGYKLVSFFDMKHIIWKGQYVLDHDKRFDKLPISKIAPLVLAHIRDTDPRGKEYFKWYTN